MPFDFLEQIDALEAVPENFRGLYVKAETGGYRIHEDFTGHVSGLRTALDKERKSAKAHAQALTAWKGIAETPEAATATITELKEAAAKAAKGGEGAVNFDKLKADLERGHAAELAKRDDALKGMRSTLDKHLIDEAATRAIAEAKGSVSLLLPHVRSAVKVVEENGAYAVRVLDKDGDPRGDAKGGFMSIADFVNELKAHKDYGRAFESSGNTGGGKSPSSSKSAGAAGSGGGEKSPVAKIAAGLGQLTKR